MTDRALMLPEGDYPFIDRRLPLNDMAWIEMPDDLEDVVVRTAAENGIALDRGNVVELTCKTPMGDATFTIYWPADSDRVHMLAPKGYQRGRA